MGIVFDEFQTMTTTDIPYPIGIGATAVEMDYHHGTGAWGNGLFDKGIVNLENVDVGLNQNRSEAVFGDSENGGDIGIGWYDNLVAISHNAHLFICSEDERQCIKPIATADAVASAYIVGIMLFEQSCRLATKIPPPLQHILHSLPNLRFVRSIHLF